MTTPHYTDTEMSASTRRKEKGAVFEVGNANTRQLHCSDKNQKCNTVAVATHITENYTEGCFFCKIIIKIQLRCRAHVLTIVDKLFSYNYLLGNKTVTFY